MTVEDLDLVTLPTAEDDLHEYKSSATPNDKLAEKLARAASGFWNSGGGLFVAGLDNATGRPDGGITPTVGRQSRRDWIDRIVNQVTPAARYFVKVVENRGGCPTIIAGNVISLVAF